MLCHDTRTRADIGLLAAAPAAHTQLPASNKPSDVGLLVVFCKVLLKELQACKAAKIAFACGAKVNSLHMHHMYCKSGYTSMHGCRYSRVGLSGSGK